jgi:saccharopine dehydrogenase-like NADP-dependent oxidoreductase
MMNMVETTLVTGACGNVGSEVIKQISNTTRDVNIRPVVHSVENIKKVVNSERIEPAQIDYYKPETLKEALKDVHKIFFVAPESPKAIELASNMLTAALYLPAEDAEVSDVDVGNVNVQH